MRWHKVIVAAVFPLVMSGYALAMDLAHGTAAETEVGAAFVAGVIAQAAAMLSVPPHGRS